MNLKRSSKSAEPPTRCIGSGAVPCAALGRPAALFPFELIVPTLDPPPAAEMADEFAGSVRYCDGVVYTKRSRSASL